METPDILKKWLGCKANECEVTSCAKCKYFHGYELSTREAARAILAYIQQLEKKAALYDEAVTDALQFERQRDAAIADYKLGVRCETCKHYFADDSAQFCLTCHDDFRFENWQWRGIQEVE